MYGAIKLHVPLVDELQELWLGVSTFDLRHKLDYFLGTFLALPGKLDFEDMGIRKDLHLKSVKFLDGYASNISNMAGCTPWFGIVSIPTIPLASSCFFNEGGFTDIEKQNLFYISF
ncbi:hypothetical protein ACJX0J_030939 [Zea mays]